MINEELLSKELLDSFSTNDKNEFQNTLLTLIKQSFEVENSYKSLQLLMSNMIDSLPNAVWVLSNENASIFMQNSEAKKINHLLAIVDLSSSESECEFDGKFYLVKITFHQEQTIVTATDITDHKRKERLAHMGQIAAHLAHEIRNPIGAVSNYASILLGKVDIKTKPIVLEVKKSIWRVERIIKTTLHFSKGISVKKNQLELQTLIDDLEVAISNYTYSKDIDIVYELPIDNIYADFELLSLVFQNLIFNAIDAIEEDDKEDGKITLSYLKNDNFYIFKVYDSGVEIEDSNKLFEAYETTKTKGNGLGLAFSKQIIEAHDGYIKVNIEPKYFEVGIKI